ncbi:helix-turn-helix domain-containing protein [Rothia dentocariosa]|uniref:helix-turn-helix domain-containing protein n=1 Tax=Rothia dentocariosa TaxID=2047 RepID=UPI0010728657|nr:helix-turn-helix domain-containing protein [Rothia dentocariosa]TFI35048.1 helix-turn-helix domain-containing protein [Rothia dentocariosa]
MSFRMVNWAYEQDLPPSPKFLLVTIADKADDDGTTAAGVDFLAYETGISTRTVIRHLKQLEELDLLHKERREYKGFGGRKTNLTILHPWKAGTKPKWHDYKKLQREAEKTKREFGVTSPVENFESAQGDNLALSSNSRADTQRDNLSSSAHKVTSVHAQGDKSCNFGLVPLKERAHGFNHQLINHQSVSQSVKSSAPVENSGQTDGSAERKNSNPPQQASVPEVPEPSTSIARGQGVTPPVQPNMQVPSASVVGVPAPVQHNPQRQGQPAPASVDGTTAAVAARGDAGSMVQGVALRQLAEDLVSDGVPAPAVNAVVQAQGLSRMVEVAMSRSQQVRSPQRYCRAVLAREWEKLVSQCAPAAYPLCARHRVRLSPAGQCRECVQESREAAEEASHSRGVNMRQVRQLAQERGLKLENIRNLELGPVVEGLIRDGVAAEAEQVACFLADNPEIISNLEQKRTA